MLKTHDLFVDSARLTAKDIVNFYHGEQSDPDYTMAQAEAVVNNYGNGTNIPVRNVWG